MSPIRRTTTRIGVDAAEDAFRLVAVRSGAVLAAIEVPIVGSEITRAQAARRAFAAMERKGVLGVRECVAVAPAQSMTTAVIELPPRASGAPVEALAAAEMMRGSSGGGLEVALFPIRAKESGPVEYFVAGAWRDGIMDLIADLAGCGVELLAVDAPACALGRACDARDCMIVAIGVNSLDFHVINRGQPILSRTVSLVNGTASSQQLIAEIDRCAGYLATYRADAAIHEIVLVGPGGGSPAVVADIEREFDVTVRVWGVAPGAGGAQLLQPAFAAAFGAATWRPASEAAA